MRNLLYLLQILDMNNSELKGAIWRIMTDLVKLDSIITSSELSFLDDVYNKYGITSRDRVSGFNMSLEKAVSVIAGESQPFRQEFYQLMEKGSVADGQCSRPEALLLKAISSSCGLDQSVTGHIYSYKSHGISLHRDQLIYVSTEDKNDRTLLSKPDVYEWINNIAKLSGFELVDVPHIAARFQDLGNEKILRDVLELVRPSLDKDSINRLIGTLRGMTPYRFLKSILNRKLQMNTLMVKGPCWLIKMGGSQVSGEEYANFLLLDINRRDMARQLQVFMSSFLEMQAKHTITLSSAEMNAGNFRYSGFIKSVLDMISMEKDEHWDIIIRLKDCKEFKDVDGIVHKASISIRRGDEEWPWISQDREAAFYAFVLCCTAENRDGVFLKNDLDQGSIEFKRYAEIYRKIHPSKKRIDNNDIPGIIYSKIRRTTVSRINLAIKPDSKKKKDEYVQKLMKGSYYLTDGDMYTISKSKSHYYVDVNSSNVFVCLKNGIKEELHPLESSELFKDFLKATE